MTGQPDPDTPLGRDEILAAVSAHVDAALSALYGTTDDRTPDQRRHWRQQLLDHAGQARDLLNQAIDAVQREQDEEAKRADDCVESTGR